MILILLKILKIVIHLNIDDVFNFVNVGQMMGQIYKHDHQITYKFTNINHNATHDN